MGKHGRYIKLTGLRFSSSLFLLSILLHNITVYFFSLPIKSIANAFQTSFCESLFWPRSTPLLSLAVASIFIILPRVVFLFIYLPASVLVAVDTFSPVIVHPSKARSAYTRSLEYNNCSDRSVRDVYYLLRHEFFHPLRRPGSLALCCSLDFFFSLTYFPSPLRYGQGQIHWHGHDLVETSKARPGR